MLPLLTQSRRTKCAFINAKSTKVGKRTMRAGTVISLKCFCFSGLAQLAKRKSSNAFNHLRKPSGNHAPLTWTSMKDAVRLVLLFGSLVGAAGAATAQQQPTAHPVSARVQEAKLPRRILLASAESAPTAAADAAADRPTPAKRVAPRITTCRCGDPLPAPEPNEQ